VCTAIPWICADTSQLYSWPVVIVVTRFFLNCTHQTKVGDSVAELIELISAVVLGRHWTYNAISFINDLITALDQHGVTAKLFADDLKLYCVTNMCDLSALYALQED